MSNQESQKRLHAIIHGKVQGVGFRANTRRTANHLDITGWVLNRSDGTVELVAEGSDEQLQQLLNFVNSGPPAANVTNIDTNWKDATGEFNGFRIRR